MELFCISKLCVFYKNRRQIGERITLCHCQHFHYFLEDMKDKVVRNVHGDSFSSVLIASRFNSVSIQFIYKAENHN